MDVKTVLELKTQVARTTDALKRLQQRLKKLGFSETSRVGPESEYDVRGLLAGIRAINTDCKALVNAPSKYLQKSASSERARIAELSAGIAAALESTQKQFKEFEEQGYSVVPEKVLTFKSADGSEHQLAIVKIPQLLDGLKPMLRDLGVRDSKDRIAVLNEECSEITRNLQNLNSYRDELRAFLEEGEKSKVHCEEVEEEIRDLKEQVESRLSELNKFLDESTKTRNSLQERLTEYEELASSIETIKDQSEELLTSAKSNEGVLDQFAKRVNQREKQLEEQEATTQAYEERLKKYEELRVTQMERAKALIAEATKSLQLTGALSLGKHFQDQYDVARKFVWAWIAGAALFFCIALGIGIWLLVGQPEFNQVVGRLSLIPLALLASGFCAVQFRYQKRIIEDYGYKKVLALSIQSFREELTSAETTDPIKLFMTSVLKQLHTSPLDGLGKDSIDRTEKALLDEIRKAIPELLKSHVKSDAKSG